MNKTPHTAMVLSAGLGMRMRPLTLEKTKPLLEVGGKAMLDSVLDRLQEAGVKKAVVNLHYLGEQIERHVQNRASPQIVFSYEKILLDTGGGIKHALTHLGDDHVFVINADLPWQDGSVPALQRLAAKFDDEKMDALLLLMPLAKARGFSGAQGDFFLEDEGGGFGKIKRLNTAPPRPYVFVSAQIIKPQLFKNISEDIFSTNLVWNKIEEKSRLYGLIHDAGCFHVGTPPDLEEANRLLKQGVGW